MTAQSIITNVNKSEYVTMLSSPLLRLKADDMTALSAALISILLSMNGFAHN